MDTERSRSESTDRDISGMSKFWSLRHNRLTRKRTYMFLASILFLFVYKYLLSKGDVCSEENADLFNDEGEDTINDLDSIEDIFLKRKRIYEDVCSARNQGNVKRLLIDKSSLLAVCQVPKSGSTFWRRVMFFLHQEMSSKPYRNPFDIDRYTVHYARANLSFEYKFRLRYRRIAASLVKVLFARDPYTRLWSTYVDKIVLPDSWDDLGAGILHSTSDNMSCPDSVSFTDFLRYALYEYTEDHWAPIHTLCNPCKFKPQYVGHMETFSRDSAYILNKAGLGCLLKNHTSHQSHVEDEMTLLIHYHFKLYEFRFLTRVCLSVVDLAERLWRVFQMNGYFSLTREFPSKIVEDETELQEIEGARDAVTKLFIDHYRQHPRSHSEWASQRELVKREAYKHVPAQLLQAIAIKYSHDFKLFGYDQFPSEYFETSTNLKN